MTPQSHRHISRRRLLATAVGATFAAIPFAALAAQPSAPIIAPPGQSAAPGEASAAEQWVQTHRATTVWVDSEGTHALAPAPQWTHFRIIGPQVSLRLPVYDGRLGAPGWIDATAVGPSGPPTATPRPEPAAPAPTSPAPAAPAAPAPVAAFEPFWIAPFKEAPLLTGARADASPATVLPQFAPIKVTGPAQGGFFPVVEPFSQAEGWIDGTVIGRVGAPEMLGSARWWGKVVVDAANARSEPTLAAPIVATYARGSTLGFSNWVEGQQVTWDDPAWGVVAPGVYVYGRLTRPIPIDTPPIPALPNMPSDRWIGINRTLQIIVAYEGATPQFWARTSTGRPGWETPFGDFTINRRVAKETMDSSTLLGRDAERADYRIEDVKYTQYFTYDGNAIHENWWKEPDTFGLPSSHGCAGLPTDDAIKFWEFGTIGMPLIVHP